MPSKSVVAFFITVQALTGFDIGFFSVLNKRYKASANCISLLSTIIILSLSIFNFHLGSYGGCFYTANYIIIVSLLKFRRFKLNIFYDELLIIDKQWLIRISDFKFIILVGFHAFTITFSRWMVSIAYAYVFGCHEVEGWLEILLPVVPLVVSDLVPIINAIVFHDVYKRFDALKNGLISSKYDIISAQVFFNDIANCLKKVRMDLDNLIFLTFITDTVKFMTYIYVYLCYVLKNPNWIIQVIGSIYPMYHLVQIFLPALFAEMIAVRVDEIKNILHDRLLFEQDETKCTDLLRMLRYVKARPLLCNAWRLVPVDLRQPVTVLSICITYLIVIIQLTHLFD